MVNENSRSILSKEYVADLLIFLIGKDEVICGDLSVIITSPTTKRNIVKKIADAGLISIRKVERPRKTYHIKLTLFGIEIAKDLKRTNDKINGLLPEEPPTNCSSPSSAQNMVR